MTVRLRSCWISAAQTGNICQITVPVVADGERRVEMRQEVWDNHGGEHTACIRQVGQAHVRGIEVGDLRAGVVHEVVDLADDSDASKLSGEGKYDGANIWLVTAMAKWGSRKGN